MKLALLHGWAMHGGIWGPLLPALEQYAPCQILELPGHGHEPMIEGDYSLAALADHLAGSIEQDTVLLGWSLGAMTAMQLALSHPGKLRALILVAASPRFVNQDHWQHGLTADVLEGFARELDTGVDKTLGRFLSLQLGGVGSTEQLREMRQLVKSRPVSSVEVMRAGLQLLSTTDLRQQVKELDLPILLIHGSRDRLMPVSAAQWLDEVLPNSVLNIIDKAGHAPFLSHTTEVTTEVAAFLQRLGEKDS